MEKPSEELVRRLVDAARSLTKAWGKPYDQSFVQYSDFYAIVAELPRPVDQVIVAAREIYAEELELSYREAALNGKYDDAFRMQVIIKAIRRGMELAQSKAAS